MTNLTGVAPQVTLDATEQRCGKLLVQIDKTAAKLRTTEEELAEALRYDVPKVVRLIGVVADHPATADSPALRAGHRALALAVLDACTREEAHALIQLIAGQVLDTHWIYTDTSSILCSCVLTPELP
jgi:hypothetical protein